MTMRIRVFGVDCRSQRFRRLFEEDMFFFPFFLIMLDLPLSSVLHFPIQIPQGKNIEERRDCSNRDVIQGDTVDEYQ